MRGSRKVTFTGRILNASQDDLWRLAAAPECDSDVPHSVLAHLVSEGVQSS